MKKLYKAALLAALGLAGVTAAQAQTQDILVGFNDAAGPTSAHNDYVIDVGYSGSDLFYAALAAGGTIDLTSTFSSSLWTTAFSTDSGRLNNVAVGASGSVLAPYPQWLYASVGIRNNLSSSAFNNAKNLAGAPDINEYGSGNVNGWSVLINSSTSAIDAGTFAQNIGTNPLESLSSGSLTETLYGYRKDSSSATPFGPTAIGTFSFNLTDPAATSGVIQFTAAPEPSTYALATCAALLTLSLRRKFTRKNA